MSKQLIFLKKDVVYGAVTILNLSKHLVTNNDSSMWCFCVEYIEGSKTVGVNEASSPKVDYKDVLSED